ncbi:transglutaminase-like superfamily protein [Ruminiclostridium hungatei]|uniref:Transglutaminase-like superfamily protein n=1 Tax=Ruminiclostridium hungatei TaxID=48256 RepID=A0A1V4SI32_RUMHU|nr:transglutaminase domain-containing protein [Ruminiclostridium hungatei]OPX42897.1 transglutaminase-like superfamily protein [Ruminiclostridium hungatei]
MKKISTVLLVLLAALLTVYSSSFTTASAASSPYFSNNKALDAVFAKLEKEFLQYKKDEVIPLKSLGAIITDGSKPTIKRTSKKMTDAQLKAAAQRALNELRVAVEVKEEYLGGLSPQEYKVIEDRLNQKIYLSKNTGVYGWDYEGKTVTLYADLSDFTEWLMSKDMTGNYGRMGKEKDQVDPAALKVKDKITRYLNQSIQKGNTVSPKILEQLPGEVEKLFIERNLSKIMASRILSEIHEGIFTIEAGNSLADRFDGIQSVEELIESFGYLINSREGDRERQKQIEYYEYPEDKPSAEAWDTITKRIAVYDQLPEALTHGFNKAITLGELAQLYFGKEELSEKIVIDDNSIPADSPDYIKQAYAYGMLDDTKGLDKPLTRLEAARILAKAQVYDKTFFSLKILDANKIPAGDLINVGTCLNSGMRIKSARFDPQGSYTKEDAIMDDSAFEFEDLRGYRLPFDMWDLSKVVVGKNTINLLFEDKAQILEYIDDNFYDTILEKIKLTGSYTKIDTGGALIEVFTPENGIKFTMKNGTTFIDLEEGDYGPKLGYTIEPKVIKSSDKVDMNMQPDSVTKKLNGKLDAIVAKIIKPTMTVEQKVRAIHDYVVKHITYDLKYRDVQSVGSVMISIDQGRGVCGDYSQLFKDLCERVSIPCVYEAGDPYTLNHAWNAVFINGEWKYVDTTWDDKDDGKVRYTYFLVDRFTFMKDHTPFMGVPDIRYYSDAELDPMKLKNQDEIRAYLLKNFYWVDGYKLTFRVADKNIKPAVGYLNDPYVSISLTYDSKNNLYTVAAKSKK